MSMPLPPEPRHWTREEERRRLRPLLFVWLVLIPTLFLAWHIVQGQSVEPQLVMTGPGRRYTETIPVYDARDLGYQPVALPEAQPGGGSNPANPYATIRQTGPTFVQPGAAATYAITLANFESLTRTYQLTDTLPPGLTFIPGSARELDYNPATRTLTWQGELAPGHLDYLLEPDSLNLPYLDLADFGAANLCDDFISNGEACDDVTVTFNLGVNDYSASLYGELLSQITLSSNGLILAGDSNPAASHHNQWLPHAAAPNFLLAGLWRDVDMTSSGRWHAAIITGLIVGHEVFYAQWHDAPHAAAPDLTARHAIALVLDGTGPVAGDLFFIYDNIADPAQTVARGYSIGVEDKLGVRGLSVAYAPCCNQPQPPLGYPPAAGTTLHLRPVLFGAANAYWRTFTYTTRINAAVPETLMNTVTARSSSADPALTYVWSTHRLYVRWQTYLPFFRFDEVLP